MSKLVHQRVGLLLVFLLGICYLIFLASSIQPEVFFQGDGGLKFMVVKQIDQGHEFKKIIVDHPAWVQDIWNHGFFPIKKPFIYPSAQGYIVSFPPGFQLLSAFLYSEFGYIGLYILPILSTILLWMSVSGLLRHLNVSSPKQMLAMSILIFCSPLTIYGLTYWEHMPATFLLFNGTVFILRRHTGTLSALLLGGLCGLAVWLRPEALLLNVFYGGVALILYRGNLRSSAPAFLAGIAVSVIGFFIFNKIYYDSFLGIHSYQVLREGSLYVQLIRWGKNLLMINWLLVKFFPFVLLMIPVVYDLVKRKPYLHPSLQWCILIVPAFCFLTPAILPNTGGGQWGPRYFLPVIPIVIVVTVLASANWRPNLQRLRVTVWAIPLLFSVLAYSAYLNSYKGGIRELRCGYHNRIKPALLFVRAAGEDVVVVGSEHITMELGALFNGHYFFLVDDNNGMDDLCRLLKRDGVKSFLYINEKNSFPGNIRLLQLPVKREKRGSYYLGRYLLR